MKSKNTWVTNLWKTESNIIIIDLLEKYKANIFLNFVKSQKKENIVKHQRMKMNYFLQHSGITQCVHSKSHSSKTKFHRQS